jgi:hypothetical protein
MKRIAASILSVASFLCCLPRALQAQAAQEDVTAQAPIVPMNIRFRYVHQYFMQSIDDNPRYSRIEALIDHGRYEVILTDKSSNRNAFYANSEKRIDVLQANGADAYLFPVEVEEFTTVDRSPGHVIRLRDTFGQEIQWRFVEGGAVAHARPEIIFQANPSGLAWMYAPHRIAPAAGTEVTIGDRRYQAQASEPGGDYRAFYSTDMTIVQFIPGTQLWSVEVSPKSLIETERWDLKGEGGQKRLLVIKSISDRDASIEQIDLSDPDSAHVLLDLDRSNGSYLLRSVSMTTQANTLWVFFDPGLPFPAQTSDNNFNIAFSIAENEQANIANGSLAVRRTCGTEHVAWQFNAPAWARVEGLETGVNVISSQAAESSADAKCADEDCSVLLP